MKARFDKLLEVVGEVSKAQAEKYTGQTVDVLVEDVDSQDETLVTGRMANNMLVHFPGCKELIGTIVDVKLNECKGFYFLGEMV